VPTEAVHELQDISLSSEPSLPAMEAILAKFPLSANGNRTKGAKKDAKAAEDFVKRRAGPAHEILDEVFTSFGSNKNGMFGATLDNPMCFNESDGLFNSVAKAFCSCFTPEELNKFKQSTGSFNRHSRLSVQSDFPGSE
jgi:hypothetical protein